MLYVTRKTTAVKMVPSDMTYKVFFKTCGIGFMSSTLFLFLCVLITVFRQYFIVNWWATRIEIFFQTYLSNICKEL